MASISLIQNNFISGEVSPLLEGRVESARYQTGLRTCQNALSHKYGGWMKRPGTKYAGAPLSNGKSRLIEHVDADASCFIIELTNLKARVWSQSTCALAEADLTTPWPEAALADIKTEITGGKMYLVHPDYAPRIIANTLGPWTITTPTFTGDRLFNSAGNYPSVVFSIAGRLGFAATDNEPTSIFLSRSPVATTGAMRHTDFLFTDVGGYVVADSAIYLMESDLTSILWAQGGSRLFTGTHRQIWTDVGAGVTPIDLDMAPVSNNGSSKIQAVLNGSVLAYVGRGGESLRAILLQGDSFQEIDLSMSAEHFLSCPVAYMAIQNYPQTIIWVVRQDGLLVSCSIDMSSGMVAWARHPMGGIVESIAVGHSNAEDMLWLSVLRGTTRTIEYLRFQNIEAIADEDYYYVDCGISVANDVPTATVTGLSHLEGKTVAALVDGATVPDMVVTSGQVVLPAVATKVNIGLPIATVVETLRPEIPANGTSQGSYKQVEQVMVRVYRSAGGTIAITGGYKNVISRWNAATLAWASVTELFTGDIESKFAAPIEKNATLVIEHAQAAPFNLLAVVYRVGMREV